MHPTDDPATSDRPKGWARLDAWSTTLADHPRTVFAALALFLGIQVSSLPYTAADGCAYLSIARSMVRSDTLSSLGERQLFYSLGYPCVVAPAFFFGDRPLLAVSVIHWVLALLLMAGVYYWARPLGPRAAVFCMALTVVHIGFGLHYRRPLSELAFMTSLVGTVLVVDRARTAASLGGLVAATVAGAVMVSFTCLIRPIGIMLAPGLGVAMLLAARKGQRSWTAAIATTLVVGGVASAVFLISRAWDDQHAVAKQSVTYWDYLVKLQDPETSVLGRIPEGIRIQMADFQRLSVPGMLKARARKGQWLNINTALSLAMTALLAAGWWQLVKRTNSTLVWTVPFYVGLNIVWAADASTRYSLPLLPVMIAAGWMALEAMRFNAARTMLVLLGAHTVVSLGYWLGTDLPRTLQANNQWPAVDALCAEVMPLRETLAVWNLSAEERDLFRLTLDRHVQQLEDGPLPADPEATWIATKKESRPPEPTYILHAEAGDFRLWRRDPARLAEKPATDRP